MVGRRLCQADVKFLSLSPLANHSIGTRAHLDRGSGHSEGLTTPPGGKKQVRGFAWLKPKVTRTGAIIRLVNRDVSHCNNLLLKFGPSHRASPLDNWQPDPYN